MKSHIGQGLADPRHRASVSGLMALGLSPLPEQHCFSGGLHHQEAPQCAEILLGFHYLDVID